MTPVLLFLLSFASISGVAAARSLLAPPGAYLPDELLVQFEAGVPAACADQLHRQLGSRLRRDLGRGLHQIRRPAGSPLEPALQAYQAHPAVEFAQRNYYAYPQQDLHPDDPRYLAGNQWGLDKIDAPRAWAMSTGDSTIVVAVIDSGIDYHHPDLAANIWINPGERLNHRDEDRNGYVDDLRGWNFHDRNNDPIDVFGHGTRVAGIIGAVGNNALGIAGVAWNVRLMALRIASDTGKASTSAIRQAIDYAIDNGARVINLSYTFSSDDLAIRKAIERADRAGVLFVTIAGNDGKNLDASPIYPAAYNLPNMITVAAVDRDDRLRSASSFGAATVHLTAPGTGILSTARNNQYGTASGTSYAAPFVAGVAALLMARHPHLTHLEVRDRILAGVDLIPGLQGQVSTGGRLNAFGALTGLVVSLPDTAAPYGSIVSLPVSLENRIGQAVVRIELAMTYRAALFSQVQATTAGSLVEDGWSVDSRVVSGHGGLDTLALVLQARDRPLTESGKLLYLRLTTADRRFPDSTALQLSQVRFDDGQMLGAGLSGSLRRTGSDGMLTTSPVVRQRQDSVLVEVVDPDLDVNPLKIDTAWVEVVTRLRQTSTMIPLPETGLSTGQFRARLPVEPFELQAGDQLAVHYTDALTRQGGAIQRTSPVEVIERFGDLLADGRIGEPDAQLLLHFAAGRHTPSNRDRLVGNVSGSGQLQAFDASLMLQFAAGLLTRFPAEGAMAAGPGDNPPPQLEPVGDHARLLLGLPRRLEQDLWEVPLHLTERRDLVAVELELTSDADLELEDVLFDEAYRDYLVSHRGQDRRLRLVLAGARPAPAGPGELARLRLRVAAPARVRLMPLFLNNQRQTAAPVAVELPGQEDEVLPAAAVRLECWLNAADRTVVIRFSLPQPEQVTLAVHNPAGQRVVTLLLRHQEAGTHQVSWDATGRQGERLAGGVYTVRLQTRGAVQTRKIRLPD